MAIYKISAIFAESLSKITDVTWISDKICDVSLLKNNNIFAQDGGLMTYSVVGGLNLPFF